MVLYWRIKFVTGQRQWVDHSLRGERIEKKGIVTGKTGNRKAKQINQKKKINLGNWICQMKIHL